MLLALAVHESLRDIALADIQEAAANPIVQKTKQHLWQCAELLLDILRFPIHHAVRPLW